MTPLWFCGTIPGMRVAVFTAILCVSISSMVAAQGARSKESPLSPQAKVAQAYEQFLIGHHLEDTGDLPGAIAAYKKAIDLHPLAADIHAELAALYMRHDRGDEAVSTAEQALKVAPANAEAHRVLGLIEAAKMDGRPRQGNQDLLNSAIQHLVQAIANPVGEADVNARAMLARLYVRNSANDKAIPLL